MDSSELVEAVTVEGMRVHLDELQGFADAGDGTRETTSDGYIDSAIYVSTLMSQAGYDVDLQVFPYVFYQDVTPPELEIVSPEPTVFVPYALDGFLVITYSGSGDVTAPATAVDVQIPAGAQANSSTSGCEAEDFDGFPEGNIAIVQRGTCLFIDKALNAQEAGASAIVIFNEGQEERTDAVLGTFFGPEVTIPAIISSYAIGEQLAESGQQVRVKVDSIVEDRVSANVIAESPIGRPDRTLVVGAHLDSVAEGAGINDNGSGTAAQLEIALKMAELGFLDESARPRLNNRVRFAWWGAEELGLIGSYYYVDTLEQEQLDDIALNLNFDMIASPNFMRGIYDGDGSDTEVSGPDGSAFIEWMFRDWFDRQGLASMPTDFSGRSDYAAFLEVGIPAGGLFSGAEGVKTEEEAVLFGGTAGEAYDVCYHLECDTIDNINDQALGEFSDAMAHVIQTFATNALPEPRAAKAVATTRSDRSARGGYEVQFDYRGKHHLVR